MVINLDPVATGLVDSLARPEGQYYGNQQTHRRVEWKAIGIAIEAVPGLSRVGIFWDATNEGSKMTFKEYQVAARALKTRLQSLEVRGSESDLRAHLSAKKGRAGAVIVIGGALLNR